MATIGIDVTPLQSRYPGGIGTSTYHCLRSLRELSGLDLALYCTQPPVVPFDGAPLDLGLPIRTGTGPLSKSNILWIQCGLWRLLEKDGVDVFWGTRHVLPRLRRSTALVATIHDLWHLRFPEQQPWLNRTLNRYVVDRAVRDADLVVTPSAATAQEVAATYHLDAANLRVVPWGVDALEFAASEDSVTSTCERLGITKPFLLAMDVHNPRKNFAAVLKAVSSLEEKPMLVGLGQPRATAANLDMHGVIASLGLQGKVILPGDVTFGDLKALYAGATAFVYPSAYEGFGMPVLEAMAAGTPVITSNTSSLPEVAGEAALLVDPTDGDSMARAIRAVMGDVALRDKLAFMGRERAAEFTWRRTAEMMRDVFELAIERKRARR